MDTDEEEPLYKAESQSRRRGMGSAMEVLNEIGHGFHEKPYENALVVEFRLRGIPCLQQKQFDILYKEQKVGEYVPDLIAYEKIVVDAKVIEKITDREIGQMMNYLKVTGLRLGYILNFKQAKLEWKRVVHLLLFVDDIKLFLLETRNAAQTKLYNQGILVGLLMEPMPNLIEHFHRRTHNLLRLRLVERLLFISVHQCPSVVGFSLIH
jgi:GxxExxY protein